MAFQHPHFGAPCRLTPGQRVPSIIDFTDAILIEDCRPPPIRDHEELADVSDKKSYLHGDEVIYNCQPGYIKFGRIKLRCNNGKWVQSTPHVQCRRCAPLCLHVASSLKQRTQDNGA
nr:complement factor H-like isoform X1 [Zootoca vivipara]